MTSRPRTYTLTLSLLAALLLVITLASTAQATTIFVNTYGDTVAIDVAPEDTVATVKAKIAAETGVPVEQQVLVFSGRHLSDTMTLDDYNVHTEATLHLLVRASSQ